MTLHFSRKQLTILILSIVIVFGAAYLAYFMLVNPVNQKIAQLENSLKTEQRLLELVSERQQNDEPVVSSTEIQKKIPVIPLVEQLILDIERAETLSESKVINMSYSESQFVPNPEEITEDVNAENTVDTDQENTQDETKQPEETATIDPELVEGLGVITVTLSVESPNYRELEKFLSVVEHQTRITKVDTLSFTGTSELTSADQVPAPLVYNVTISSFYAPKYTELADEAPILTVPTPGNKKNPLATGLEEDSSDDE
ncbi:hypothetical protein [Bacillus sinesaloumensis]|uniref:hypothetical protein n=1 Tax=Litchfieldia sinesaloumensis TaxID=1926280 RepID=UPI0009882EBD|nr:hypothetical protein [Bacillus sinesaloumensis]